MSSKPVLRVDWCSHEAAKYAVEHWHYSRRMPRGKLAKLGVWEDGQFIGCVLFGQGNGRLGTSYGLTMQQSAELSRVALKVHNHPVSRIVSLSIKIMHRSFPSISLLVSYADPSQGHNGGIYQAMNWIYVGSSAPDIKYIDKTGQEWHSRSISKDGFKIQFGRRTYTPPVSECLAIPLPPKHKYLYPLDDAMRKQIAPLAKPYPKRSRAEGVDSDTPAVHAGEGGAIPTSALHRGAD